MPSFQKYRKYSVLYSQSNCSFLLCANYNTSLLNYKPHEPNNTF